MKSTQPCQVHIPWVGEPSLRSFVQFSPYLFFNVISKKCPKLSISSDWRTSCPQGSWECSPAFALVSLSFPVHSTLLTAPHCVLTLLLSISFLTEKPAFSYVVSAREGSQHCDTHSLLGWARLVPVVHLGFLPLWDNCELTVYKVIVLCYFNFWLYFFRIFLLTA